MTNEVRTDALDIKVFYKRGHKRGQYKATVNKSLFKWLAGKIKSDQTEVIIFFAGHGLASNNGKELYFLPQDGDPDLLKRTAISRSDLVQEIVNLKPRSVTMFLDMCYSGVSRNDELIVSNCQMKLAESSIELLKKFIAIPSQP